jgi:hypothetical protein
MEREPESDMSQRVLNERLRLHRRTVHQDGREYQVLSLRTVDPVRFSVELDPAGRGYPLIRSDLTGARLLGRLLWGLSSHRHPDTVLVLDRGHLVVDPYDGGPSPVVVFAVASRTVLGPALIRRLRQSALWRTPSMSTVSWKSAGLSAAVTEVAYWQEARRSGAQWPTTTPDPPDAIVREAASVVTVSAVPQLLRSWATRIVQAGDYWSADESCTEPSWGRTGIDVHAVRQFHRLVSAAELARAEVVAAPDCPSDPAELSRRIGQHREVVSARRPGPWDAPPVFRPGVVRPTESTDDEP